MAGNMLGIEHMLPRKMWKQWFDSLSLLRSTQELRLIRKVIITIHDIYTERNQIIKGDDLKISIFPIYLAI